MKKSALALAVAAALVGFGSAAYADTTLYGSARVSVDWVDNNLEIPAGSAYGTVGADDSWDVANNASRLGVRGEEDLGGGLSAIYQYEFGVDVTEGGTGFNSNRPKWVGLKGSNWGSLTLGTQWTPYYNVIGVADVFNSARPFSNSSVYLGAQFGTRMDNSVVYTTPNWSGFSAQAMLVMNGSCVPSDPQTANQLCSQAADNRLPSNLSNGIDMWQINATYKNGPFFVGATYMALDGDDLLGVTPVGSNVRFSPTIPAWDGDQWGLAFGYNQGPFAVTLTYENGDLNNLYYGTTQNVYVTGQYTFGNNIIRAAYGYVSPDDGDYVSSVTVDPTTGRVVGATTRKQFDINNYILGYQYNFSKRTRVWVEYIGQDIDSDLVGDKQTVSIGTRHDF